MISILLTMNIALNDEKRKRVGSLRLSIATVYLRMGNDNVKPSWNSWRVTVDRLISARADWRLRGKLNGVAGTRTLESSRGALDMAAAGGAAGYDRLLQRRRRQSRHHWTRRWNRFCQYQPFSFLFKFLKFFKSIKFLKFLNFFNFFRFLPLFSISLNYLNPSNSLSSLNSSNL